MRKEFLLYMLGGIAICVGILASAAISVGSLDLLYPAPFIFLLLWLVLWALCYPFLLLIYFSIDTILVLLGFPVDKVKLR